LDLLRRAFETGDLQNRIETLEMTLAIRKKGAHDNSQDHRVSKLYDALTFKEKGAAVFACLDEVRHTRPTPRIALSLRCPTRTYRTLDLDYGDRLSRLSDMSSFWGLHHWREMTVMTAAMALMCRGLARPGTTIWVSNL